MPVLKIKFGVLSDLHYAKEDCENRHRKLSIQKLTAAIAAFKELNIDFIINLGDTIDTVETIDAEIELCKEINSIFDTIAVPVYHVVGNHDVSMFSKEEFLVAMRMKSAYYSFTCNGIRFCILDGNCHEDGSDFSRNDFSWDNAWISQAQLNWLDAEVQNSDEPTIICCHERLDGDAHISPSDPHVIQNYAELNKIIHNSTNILAIFSGHDHAGHITNINNVPYITFPAMVSEETTAIAVVEIYADNYMQINGVGRFPRISWQA